MCEGYGRCLSECKCSYLNENECSCFGYKHGHLKNTFQRF